MYVRASKFPAAALLPNFFQQLIVFGLFRDCAKITFCGDLPVSELRGQSLFESRLIVWLLVILEVVNIERFFLVISLLSKAPSNTVTRKNSCIRLYEFFMSTLVGYAFHVLFTIYAKSMSKSHSLLANSSLKSSQF